MEKFTRTPNDVLEAIISGKFNATQLKILLLVIRYTNGFNRVDHSFSLTFLANATGISKRFISKELQKLIDDGIILVSKDYTVNTSRKLMITNQIERIKGYGTIVPQMNNSSTLEQEFHSRDEQKFHTPDEQQFHQEKTKDKFKETGGFSEEFKTFWEIYPRKDNKKASYKRFTKALKNHTADELINAARNYSETVEGTETKFIKVANNFFGDEMYLDYINVEPVVVNNWRGSDKRL